MKNTNKLFISNLKILAEFFPIKKMKLSNLETAIVFHTNNLLDGLLFFKNNILYQFKILTCISGIDYPNKTKKNLTKKIIKKFQKTKTKNIIQKKFKKRIKILKNYNNNSLKVNHQKIKFLKLNHFTEQLLESLSIFTNKKFISYFFKNWKTKHILVICTISLFLLVQCSPILSILWLIISTLYLLYIHSYKDISKIWGFTIGIWYVIFTTSLSEITILIGFEQTEVVFFYIMGNSFLFENLCLQTVIILDTLSSNLGIHIWVPGIPNIFKLFAKFLKGPRTGCSGKGDSGEKNKSSCFSLGKPKKSQGELDMLICQDLAKIVAKRNPWIYDLHSSTDDGARTIQYFMTKTPWGIYSGCFAKPAGELEKQPFEDGKKTTPK
jgi:hypothetical protein